MRLRISTKDFKEESEGIVYILQIRLEERELVKIGVTTRDRVEDRVCEVLTAIWKRYRVFPECTVKRYRRTVDIYGKESYLHRAFKEFKYSTLHKFGGSTEMFLLDIEDVVSVYDELIPKKG